MDIDQQESTSDRQLINESIDETCTEVSEYIYNIFIEYQDDIEGLNDKLKIKKLVSVRNVNKFFKLLRKNVAGKLIDIFVEHLVVNYTTEEQRKAFIREVCKIVMNPSYVAEKLRQILNKEYVKEEYSNTSLHLAAEQGNLNAVKYFVEKGDDISAQDEMGYVPLHLAAKQGNLDIVEYLIEKGANVDAWQDGWSYSTVLHLAAENGHLDTVKYLIEKGADPKATDSDGKTPMQRANENGHLDIVEYFASQGLQVTEAPQVTERQQTTEKQQIMNEDDDTPLHLAAEQGNLNAVKYLIEKGTDVDVLNFYLETPLHVASRKGNLEIAQFLLDHGANVNAQTFNDFTPLLSAVTHSHLAMVKLLLDHCADVNMQESESFAKEYFGYGFTPLMRAAYNCNTEIARLLLDNGADVSITGLGLTALDFANNNKCETEMLTLLKDGNIKSSDSRNHCISTMAAHNTVKPMAASSTVKPMAAISTVKPMAASSTVKPMAASSIVKPMAASSTVKPYSFINSMFNWVGASTTAVLSSIFQSTPALPSAQQPVTYSGENFINSSQVGFGGMAFLADVVIRKFTRQKYSRPLDDSLLTLEQIKERKLSAIEDVKMAISKFEKLDRCPGSSLSNNI